MLWRKKYEEGLMQGKDEGYRDGYQAGYNACLVDCAEQLQRAVEHGAALAMKEASDALKKCQTPDDFVWVVERLSEFGGGTRTQESVH